MAVNPQKLLTYADYTAFPDDGIRHEIIAGKDYILAAPSIKHQNIVLALGSILRAHTKALGSGFVAVAPLDVRLSEHDVVQPDCIFVDDTRREIIGEATIDGAPTLVVEVLSDVRRDRLLKRDRYARAGVSIYWIIDPESERVEVYSLQASTYPKPTLFERGDILTIPNLPGLEITVTDLLN